MLLSIHTRTGIMALFARIDEEGLVPDEEEYGTLWSEKKKGMDRHFY
jgi:hypothetical protein